MDFEKYGEQIDAANATNATDVTGETEPLGATESVGATDAFSTVNAAGAGNATDAVNGGNVFGADYGIPSDSLYTAQMPYAQMPDAPAPKKSKKVWLWILIPFLVLIVSAVGIYICAAPYVNNFFAKTFLKPDQYYQKIEGENIGAFSKEFSKYYSEQLLPRMRLHDRYYDTETEIRLEEEGKELLALADLKDIDLSWLESVKVSVTSNAKDDVNSSSVEASLNNTKLLTLGMLLDRKNECIYLAIPELSEAYICMKEDSGFLSSLDELRESSDRDRFSTVGSGMDTEDMEKLYSVLPTETEVDELIGKYSLLALSEIHDVSKEESVEVKAGEITQKATKLVIKIDEDTLKTIETRLLDEASQDEDLRAIIMDIAEALGQDEYDVYDTFKDKIDELKEDVSDIELEDPIKLTVYVDGKGTVFARELEVNDEYYAYKILQEKSQTVYYICSEADGNTVEFEMTGELSDKEFDGDYEIRYNDSSFLIGTMSCPDLAAMKNGEYQIDFTVALSSGATKKLGNYAIFLKKWNIKCSVEGTANSYNTDLTLYDADDKIISVKTATTIEEGHENSIPDTNVIMVDKEDDLEEWMKTIEWDGFLDSLERAGMPGEWVDTLRNYVNYPNMYY